MRNYHLKAKKQAYFLDSTYRIKFIFANNEIQFNTNR